jgi:hypothetical protein
VATDGLPPESTENHKHCKMFSLNLNTVEESDKLRIWEIFQGMGPGHLKIIIINDNNKNGSEFA